MQITFLIYTSVPHFHLAIWTVPLPLILVMATKLSEKGHEFMRQKDVGPNSGSATYQL